MAIYNHKADNPLYMSDMVIRMHRESMVIHDTDCPNSNQMSLKRHKLKTYAVMILKPHRLQKLLFLHSQTSIFTPVFHKHNTVGLLHVCAPFILQVIDLPILRGNKCAC